MPVTSASQAPSIAWCCTGTDGSVLAERDADRPVAAASTIKLLVLAALLRAADDHRLALDDVLTVRSDTERLPPRTGTFDPDPDDADTELPPAGTSSSLRDVATWMIARSSNEATNLLVDHLGIDAVRAEAHLLGCSGTVFARKLGDVGASAAGLENTVTARDLVRVMRRVVGSAEARAMLGAQRFPHIALELRTEDRWWGSKSGWIPGVVHDVAAVELPEDPETATVRPVVLAVCTEGFDEQQGDAVIRSVAAVLQSCFKLGK